MWIARVRIPLVSQSRTMILLVSLRMLYQKSQRKAAAIRPLRISLKTSTICFQPQEPRDRAQMQPKLCRNSRKSKRSWRRWRERSRRDAGRNLFRLVICRLKFQDWWDKPSIRRCSSLSRTCVLSFRLRKSRPTSPWASSPATSTLTSRSSHAIQGLLLGSSWWTGDLRGWKRHMLANYQSLMRCFLLFWKSRLRTSSCTWLTESTKKGWCSREMINLLTILLRGTMVRFVHLRIKRCSTNSRNMTTRDRKLLSRTLSDYLGNLTLEDFYQRWLIWE